MVARFSRENERLAQHAEQLRGSKQVVANDYKGEPQVKSIPACFAMQGRLWNSLSRWWQWSTSLRSGLT